MLNPQDQAGFDQAAAAIAEMMPELWWQLYQGCTEKGFTPEQSMELLKVFISTLTHQVNATT